MPISALVLTLSEDAMDREQALNRLGADRRLELGVLNGAHLPVVAETETIREGTKLVRDELMAIDGVVFVDVAWVDFSDVEF